MSGQLEQSRSIGGWFVCALALAVGCSSKPPAITPQNDTRRLGAIQYAYQEATRNLQHPPEKLDDIQPYLAKLGNPAELLTSLRDGKPYVIVWNVDLENPVGAEDPVYAYEQVGLNGERMVLSMLDIKRVPEADFSKLNLPQPK